MRKIVKLTENNLHRIVKQVITEVSADYLSKQYTDKYSKLFYPHKGYKSYIQGHSRPEKNPRDLLKITYNDLHMDERIEIVRHVAEGIGMNQVVDSIDNVFNYINKKVHQINKIGLGSVQRRFNMQESTTQNLSNVNDSTAELVIKLINDRVPFVQWKKYLETTNFKSSPLYYMNDIPRHIRDINEAFGEKVPQNIKQSCEVVEIFVNNLRTLVYPNEKITPQVLQYFNIPLK